MKTRKSLQKKKKSSYFYRRRKTSCKKNCRKSSSRKIKSSYKKYQRGKRSYSYYKKRTHIYTRRKNYYQPTAIPPTPSYPPFPPEISSSSPAKPQVISLPTSPAKPPMVSPPTAANLWNSSSSIIPAISPRADVNKSLYSPPTIPQKMDSPSNLSSTNTEMYIYPQRNEMPNAPPSGVLRETLKIPKYIVQSVSVKESPKDSPNTKQVRVNNIDFDINILDKTSKNNIILDVVPYLPPTSTDGDTNIIVKFDAVNKVVKFPYENITIPLKTKQKNNITTVQPQINNDDWSFFKGAFKFRFFIIAAIIALGYVMTNGIIVTDNSNTNEYKPIIEGEGFYAKSDDDSRTAIEHDAQNYIKEEIIDKFPTMWMRIPKNFESKPIAEKLNIMKGIFNTKTQEYFPPNMMSKKSNEEKIMAKLNKFIIDLYK